MLIKEAVAVLNSRQSPHTKRLDMIQDLLSLYRTVSRADTLSTFKDKVSPIIEQCQAHLLVFLENFSLRPTSWLVPDDSEFHPYGNDEVDFRVAIVMCCFYIKTLLFMESE